MKFIDFLFIFVGFILCLGNFEGAMEAPIDVSPIKTSYDGK